MGLFNRRGSADDELSRYNQTTGETGRNPWEDEKQNADRREHILPVLKLLGKLLWERITPLFRTTASKRKIKGALLILPFFLYIAGIAAQFMMQGRPTTVEEMQSGAKLPSFSPIKSFAALFTPYGPKAIMLLLAVGVIAALLIWVHYQKRSGVEYDKERNFYYSTSGTYGTAGFMKDEDIDKVLKRYRTKDLSQPTGAILGEKDGYVLTLPLDSPLNLHTCVFGASGTMKSRAWSRNRIISAALAGESIICTDSKAELFEDMSEYLRTERGYSVKVLNLIDPANGNTWSALDGVEDEELLAQTIVDVIISNTGGPRGDHFWDAAEGNLLKGLILYMQHTGRGTTLGNVYNIITGAQANSSIPELIRTLPPGSPALHSFNLFLKSSETVQSSVIIGLGSRLQVLQNPSIVDLVGTPDIDLLQPGKEKTAIFVITSDQNSTLTFISSLFFSLLFIKLVKYADTQCEGRRLKVPVNLILDEFCNIGLIPDFTKVRHVAA
jgi:type IV secretion system protein VirD4